jgi:hypothetical protein
LQDPKEATRQLATNYAKQGNPDGWFEEFYTRAEGDFRKVYWADLKPGPLLVDWLKSNPCPPGGQAIVIGCGLGDDAELLSLHGYRVTAFDISASAIKMCQQRFPSTRVNYLVADLLSCPPDWERGFDLVFECNTIQVLSGANRGRALETIAHLAAPEGIVLVSCRSRNKGEQLDSFPRALDRDEIDGFIRAGLAEICFLSYDDDQDPPVPHFFASYQRSP